MIKILWFLAGIVTTVIAVVIFYPVVTVTIHDRPGYADSEDSPFQLDIHSGRK